MEAREKEKYTGGEAVHTRSEGPTISLCGDTNVACIWITGEFSLVTKYNENFGQIPKTLHSWWRREVAKQIMVYREHNQEADHWANIGAHGRRRRCNVRSIRDTHLNAGFTLIILPKIIRLSFTQQMTWIVVLWLSFHGESQPDSES